MDRFTIILPFDNLNLPLTRGNICFPSDDFYIILPCCKVQNIEFISKQPRYFFCLYFFVIPVEIQCSSLKIKASFAFPPHPFAYFLISGYLLRTPDNSNFFSISLEGWSYRESTVHISGFSCGPVRSRFICVKKEIVSCRKVTRLPELPLACVPSVFVRFGSKVRGTRVGAARKWLSFHFLRERNRLPHRQAAPKSLFWAPDGLDELPEVLFEFPFVLIGKWTMAFFTGWLWWWSGTRIRTLFRRRT